MAALPQGNGMDVDAAVAQFVERGFVAIPALDAAQVARARAQVAADRHVFADSWKTYGQSRDGGPVGESGRFQQHTLLIDSPAFDWLVHLVLEHPVAMPAIMRIVGLDACLSGLFLRVRDPVPDPPPPPESRVEGSSGEPGVHWRMWHREEGGRCLPHHPFFLHSLQLALELDEGRPDGHCLSLVPESLAEKQALPWKKSEGVDEWGESNWQLTDPFIKKMWRNNNVRHDGVDVLCPPGTIVIFNNCSIHAGTVRQTTQPRRVLGMSFYSQLESQLASVARGLRGKNLMDGSHTSELFWARFLEKYPHLLRWVGMTTGPAIVPAAGHGRGDPDAGQAKL